MEIYVVQEGDNIDSIAKKLGVSVDKIIKDNGLVPPFILIIGQALVITYPKQTHTIQQGDALQSIADMYGVTLMQLFRNNPHLFDKEYVNTGESLVISYDTKGSISTYGFTYPFIRKETLLKTLPNLTYLSIFNYTSTEKGEIITYQDDESYIIKSAKEYGVIPLLMITTMGQKGEPNIETSYKILLNERYQDYNINEFYNIMKNKGYKGLNFVINYLNEDNQLLYESFIKKVATRLKDSDFLFFVTINYQPMEVYDKRIEQIDYAKLSAYVDGFIFLKFVWGNNYGPPAPVTNITNIKALVDYLVPLIPADKIIIGQPTIGYDWSLPYSPTDPSANSLSIYSVLALAYSVDTIIEFDEESQTPFFYYNQFNIGIPNKHIVWFTDARSINVLNNLIIEKGLNGSGIWNVMTYNAQLWTLTNSQFDIVKL